MRGAPSFVAVVFRAVRLGDGDGIARLQFGCRGVDWANVVERPKVGASGFGDVSLGLELWIVHDFLHLPTDS